MSRESGVGRRESGGGSRESGVRSRESGEGSRESGVRSRESGVGSREITALSKKLNELQEFSFLFDSSCFKDFVLRTSYFVHRTLLKSPPMLKLWRAKSG